MDRDRVAGIASGMLDAGGACVHVHATTHRGIPAEQDLPYPEPPHDELADLTDRYITRDRGPQYRVPPDVTADTEERRLRRRRDEQARAVRGDGAGGDSDS